MSNISAEVLSQFIAIVGEKHVLQPGTNDLTHYICEGRGIYSGNTPLVLKPGSTQEVSSILALANEHGIGIVPQGGHTGHAGGGVPSVAGDELVVVLDRLNSVRDIDPAGNTITVEAGVILQRIQQMADDNDRLFPLSLAAEGSCQIGGNISTNAGGTAVLSYGNTRAMVMGLEVVLPNGDIWNGLRRLKKDNAGYDLKQLFIGAEGTLGIVTAAVLKLWPKPRGREVAYVAVESPEQALALLELAYSHAASDLTLYELMTQMGLGFVFEHMPQCSDPFSMDYPWAVLLEVSSSRSEQQARETLECILEQALEQGIVLDALIATNLQQQQALRGIRESMPPAQRYAGGSIKHDISVPIHAIPEFLQRAEVIVRDHIPSARICAFGHMGDGNLHYNISQPSDMDKQPFMAHRESLNAAIHALVVTMQGSVSAEHGIGLLKRELLANTKSPVELQMMQGVKAAFDPKGIMNPGKVLRPVHK